MALLKLKLFALFTAAGATSEINFVYKLSKWSPCSDSCGPGVQTRELQCFVLLDGQNNTKRMRPIKDISKCGEHKAVLPKGWQDVKRTCTGTTPPTAFCAECPVAEEGCRRCASGFDFDESGYCRNPGLEVLIDLLVPEPFTFDWQQEWSTRLDDCAKALVREASSASGSKVRVYAISPKFASRRSRNVGGARSPATAGRGDRVVFRAAASVPQGVAAHTIRDAIKANFTSVVTGGWFSGGLQAHCPKNLKLKRAAILCPDARTPSAEGFCTPVRRQVHAMAVSTWCVFASGMLLVGAAVFCAWEPEYRKRERSLEMRSQSDMTGR